MTHFSDHVPVRHEWLPSQVNSPKNTCQRDALLFLKSPTKCCSRELSFANVFSYQGSSHREGLESFAMPQPLLNQRGPADSRIQHLTVERECPGKLVARGWHLSSLLLPIPGWVPPGHVEGKEHGHDAALLS
jgi:hypothetical protein